MQWSEGHARVLVVCGGGGGGVVKVRCLHVLCDFGRQQKYVTASLTALIFCKFRIKKSFNLIKL